MTFVTWFGGTGIWSNPNNWNGGFVPTGDALLGGGNEYAVLINSHTITPANLLEIDNPSATLEIGPQNELAIGSNSDGGLINAGTIVNSAGSFILVGQNNDLSNLPAAGTFDNTGVIILPAKGGMTIVEPLATSQLGTFQNNDLLLVAGTLDNTGATLVAANYGSIALAGTVFGGTIDGTGGTPIIGNWSQPSHYTGVAFKGTINANSGLAVIDLTSTFIPAVGQGMATLDINYSANVTLESTGIVDDLAIVLVDDGARLTVGGTLGPNTSVIVQGASGPHHYLTAQAVQGTVSSGNTLNLEVTLVQGLVTSVGTLGHATFYVTPQTLDNKGTIAAGDFGYTLVQQPVIGAGTIAAAGGGTVELAADFAGQSLAFSGTGGVIRLDGAGGTSDVYGFAPGDTIDFYGTAASIVFADGTLTATNGPNALGSFVMHGVPANARFAVATDAQLHSLVTETIPCFAAGTRIRTPRGDVAVEHLRPGDHLVSAFGGTVPIVWIGRRHVRPRRHRYPASVWPVRIHAGALADGVPARDLRLSPEHALLLDFCLVPARHLIDGIAIRQDACDAVTYFHVELPQHDVILAEGAPCESYLDCGNRSDFDNAGTAVALHPAFADAAASWQANACAPQCRAGPTLDTIRDRLRRRAAAEAPARRAGG
jgi:hypothetical protein